jgi:glutamate carboxypeptidase
VNIGVIGGGTRPNVVPGAAFAEVDFRITTRSEYDRVRSAVSALAERPVRQGASLEVSLVHERPPMERTGPIQAAAIDAKRLARLLGLELTEGDAGSGSDGNLLAPLGVAVVDGLGPEGDGAHAEHEYITVASLEERTALLALLAHAL